MLDIRQLQALVAIHDTGSIAAAARELGWSQPTVSHHLQNLERELGTAMTHRDSAGTTLTPAGEVALRGAHDILALAERTVRDVDELLARPALIRLGAIPTIGASIMPPALAELAAAGIAVSMKEDESADLESDIRARTLDAAIVMGSPLIHATYGPSYRPLFVEHLFVALPTHHPAATRATIQLSDLHADAWILSNAGPDPVDEALDAVARARGITIRSSIRSDDYSVVMAYVAAGLGVALVPESALHGGRTDVVTRELSDAGFTREIGMIVGSHAPAASLDAVMRALSHSIRAMAPRRI
ncbi:LysR family hydrogen peroxide-inducible transcriptional activator [Microbacteriaceae bacterium MWH-Ta3]|nr:LysR family hydrogen peroxide-inducible transcriptional activator [Microbacteriaceae bacterium MWH-Ta3]